MKKARIAYRILMDGKAAFWLTDEEMEREGYESWRRRL
jgi:hypothetical protein